MTLESLVFEKSINPKFFLQDVFEMIMGRKPNQQDFIDFMELRRQFQKLNERNKP